MAKERLPKIITREKLANMLRNPNRAYVEAVVGRALVAIFKRQTEDEQRSNDTRVWNSVGFTGADGHSGCLTAKTYIKNGHLLDWQLERWLKPGKNGYPRICKYWKQLNEIAVENSRRGEK